MSAVTDVTHVNARTIDGPRIVIDVRDTDGSTQYLILSRRAVRLLRETLATLETDAEGTP